MKTIQVIRKHRFTPFKPVKGGDVEGKPLIIECTHRDAVDVGRRLAASLRTRLRHEVYMEERDK